MNKPALLGGEAIRPQGPPSWPCEDDDIERILQRAYRDGSWGKYHGDFVPQLEAALRDYFQVEHVLLCASGTYAIELALRAANVTAGNDVGLAGYDYGGNFLCVHAADAHPVLFDVDADNFILSPQALTKNTLPQTLPQTPLPSSGERREMRLQALIVSHLHGGCVPMREVCAWAKERETVVIEDAAQAPGATVQGRKAGTWSDMAVVSFGGSKLLTAGRGGALLTNRTDLYQRAKREAFRGNWVCPLSELQAAVLLPQLAKLDERNAHRLQMVRRLTQKMRDVPGLEPLRNRDDDNVPAYYKVGFRFDEKTFGLDRELFCKAMRAEGIAMDKGFLGLHVGRSPRRFRAAGDLTQSQRAHDETVVLHHPVLLEGEAAMKEIVDAVEKVRRFVDEL